MALKRLQILTICARLSRMTITLSVTKRDNDTSSDTLRANGQMPAVVYGPKQEPLQIALDAKAFDKVRREAGESTIVNLDGLGEEVEVLIKDIDIDPVRLEVRHADFYAIERGKEMTMPIALHYVGEAPVEENGIGTINRVLHEVEVTCRPSNLPAHIEVDISGMDSEDSQIHVSDLPKLEGVTYEAEPEDVVAVVSLAREEEPEDEESEMSIEDVEVEAKGKSEEETEPLQQGDK